MLLVLSGGVTRRNHALKPVNVCEYREGYIKEMGRYKIIFLQAISGGKT
jgi:hypothetical protein